MVWCMASYSFFGAAVFSELAHFAYNRMFDNLEARRFCEEMGSFASILPICLAFLGFMFFWFGTTHFFVMEYRRGLADHAFTYCAAFCYIIPPFLLVGLVKI